MIWIVSEFVNDFIQFFSTQFVSAVCILYTREWQTAVLIYGT